MRPLLAANCSAYKPHPCELAALSENAMGGGASGPGCRRAAASDDVVVQIDSALPEMEDRGLVRRGRVALGATGFGIATRSGDPALDIATPDALKAVLLGAAKVIYNDPAVTPSGKLLPSRTKVTWRSSLRPVPRR